MVLHVIINGLSLGHFNVFMRSVLGVNGIQLRLGEVIDNPSPERVTYNIDGCSHPIPGDKEQKKFSEEELRGQGLEPRVEFGLYLLLCLVSSKLLNLNFPVCQGR